MSWSPELCGQNKQGSSVKGWGICAHCHGNSTGRRGRGGPSSAPLYRCKTPTSLRPGTACGWPRGHQRQVRGGWTGIPSTWRRWHRSQAGPCGCCWHGGQRALSVRTCQKYQAEIRATTPTHPAKNSWVRGDRGWGGGFPTEGLACCSGLLGGLGWSESISPAGQLRPRTGQGP